MKIRISIVLASVLMGLFIYHPARAQQHLTQNQRLAQGAYAIFEQSCLGCHGPHGAFTENLIIDSAQGLIDTGKVVPGKPIQSNLYMRLLDKDPAKRMPLGQPQLSPQVILTIGNWIQAGAPSWDIQHDVTFITPNAMLNTIQRHLGRLSNFDRPYARYFTMTHLYNAGESPEALEAYRVALSKLVNSLSWSSEIIKPDPIDTQKTIFYIDLRDYEWDVRDAWTEIESLYPYLIEFDATSQAGLRAKLENLRDSMNCEVPFVYVDWFLATATLPPLYHDILDLPATERALERELGVDVARNIQSAPGRRVWRAGFNDSGVSNHNRVVERHTSKHGAYWKSYDFAGSVGQQNIFTYPLSFQRDGGEMIFNLPNGLQAYYIVDGSGNRLAVAPTDIVSNPAASDPAVHNGLSCIGCHTEGMKTFEDTVRGVVEKTRNHAFDKEQALRLYVEQAKMDDLVKQDTARYKAALKLTGGVFGGIEPVHRLYEEYQGPVDAAHAAAAVGLETEAFLREIRNKSSLQNLGLAVLQSGENVKRDVWRANFSDIVSALQSKDSPRAAAASVVNRPTLPISPGAVNIPDANLRRVVAEQLGKAPGAVIMSADMKKLRRIEADESKISDLTGLEHATNLERIEFRHNSILDLTPLAGLIRLNNIKLRGNEISDVSPLGALTNVDWLGLEENAITDFSPLSKLVKLNGIGISGNPVSDVSPLVNLRNLDHIDAWRTPISDFSPLAKLPRLRWIEFGNDKSISAIPSLKGLKKLRGLVIHGCNISDLSKLTELTQLEWLELVNNSISDVTPLAKLKGLKTLNLDANSISDVSPLAKLSRLEVLYLENNNVSDVSPLAGLKNLERLDLRNNRVSDFSPLDKLPDETFVRMEGNAAFPVGGRKITGPWLWAIVPGTRLDNKTDFLAQATGGTATEIKVATNGAKEGKAVGKGAWRLHSISSTSGNNINEMTDALGWGTGSDIYDHIIYGSVVLDSPAKQETTMLVGSDDAVKVWLNGKLVHKAFVFRGAHDYQDSFPVTLKQGKNVLLVALDNRGHGGFSGFFGFASDAKYEVFSPPTNFIFSTAETQLTVGKTFTVHLNVEHVDSLGGWQSDVVYDRAVLKVNSVTEGDFLKQNDGQTHFEQGTIKNGLGKITGLQGLQLARGTSMSRQGTLLSIEFRALRNGKSRLTLENFQAGDRRGEKIHAAIPELTIVVGGAPASPSWNADIIPEVTALFTNYPNPFNPETYIPYQLSETADVTVRIWTADGRLIRTLDLGIQSAGVYQDRHRAGYWDGKNAVGEPVASGIYFYTLTAGDFTATRKMLIRK